MSSKHSQSQLLLCSEQSLSKRRATVLLFDTAVQLGSMHMPMVDVREMRMPVGDRLVPVLMHMRLPSIPVEVMHMPVMFVMNMGMAVRHGLMRVLVLVPFRQVKPHTEGHQRAGQPEPGADRFTQQNQ